MTPITDPAAHYWRLAGKVFVTPSRTQPDIDLAPGATAVAPLRWLGNCPGTDLTLASNRFEHNESWSGNNVTDVSNVDTLGGDISIPIESIAAENASLCLFGRTFTSGDGSVTGAYFGRKNTAGDWVKRTIGLPDLNTWLPIVKTPGKNFEPYSFIASSTLVITDSTPTTPKTLVKDTNYVLHPNFIKNGLIKFIDLTTGGTFTGPCKAAFTIGGFSDVLGQPLEFGFPYALSNPKVSDLLVKDSAGTPATVDPAYYSLDAVFGHLEFPTAQQSAFEAENYVEPITVTGTFESATYMPMLSEVPKDHFIRVAATNMLNKKNVIFEFYRVSLNPTDVMSLISKDLTKMTLRGKLVADATRPVDDVMGQFGRIIWL